MPAPAAPDTAAAAQHEPRPSAEPSRSTQGAPAQLSPDIDALSLGAIVLLLPADSAPSSPAASDGAPCGGDALAARPDGGCRSAATGEARSANLLHVSGLFRTYDRCC